jgi:hypothetical protein
MVRVWSRILCTEAQSLIQFCKKARRHARSLHRIILSVSNGFCVELEYRFSDNRPVRSCAVGAFVSEALAHFIEPYYPS